MLSLVIATPDDQGSLRACREGLRRQQDASRFEPVIVDRNEHDDGGPMFSDFAAGLNLRHERASCRARQARGALRSRGLRPNLGASSG